MTDQIPETGEYNTIYSEMDARQEYGEGWKYLLMVHWQKQFHCHWLELAVYHLPIPYKCDILLCTGTKEDIVKKLDDVSLVDTIEKHIPSLYSNLEDI